MSALTRGNPGQHEAIVDAELFEAVQARLADRSNPRTTTKGRRAVSLLAGMMSDKRGRPMSPYHTRSHGRRYSYYASNPGDGSRVPALRLPTGELDAAVRNAFATLLQAPDQLRHYLPNPEVSQLFTLADHCADPERAPALNERRRSAKAAQRHRP